jgi:hypothetical protein
MYVAIDRKPEFGCEIQDAACGKSSVMIRIKLVKTATEQEVNSVPEDDDGVLHGTHILLDLVSTWAHTDRVVCANSYFPNLLLLKRLKSLRK